MTEDCKTQIMLLPEAARNRKWNDCNAAITKLLEMLDQYTCALLILEYFEHYLPIFEKYHPEEMLPEQIIVFMKEAITLKRPAEHWRFETSTYPRTSGTPGTPSFNSAITYLYILPEAADGLGNFPEAATSPLLQILGAFREEDWGRNYPDRWQAWLNMPPPDSENAPEVVTELLAERRKYDDAKRLSQSQMVELANRLEMLLDC